jgi:ribosomal-protein-alanine N-acetyltransferase
VGESRGRARGRRAAPGPLHHRQAERRRDRTTPRHRERGGGGGEAARTRRRPRPHQQGAGGGVLRDGSVQRRRPGLRGRGRGRDGRGGRLSRRHPRTHLDGTSGTDEARARGGAGGTAAGALACTATAPWALPTRSELERFMSGGLVCPAGLEIETARLRLRPLAPEDLDAIHRIWTDPEVRRYLWDGKRSPGEVAAGESRIAARFESGPAASGLWSSTNKRRIPDRVLRVLALRRRPDLELAYGLSPAVWGAASQRRRPRPLIRYGFEEAGLDRIARARTRRTPPRCASWQGRDELRKARDPRRPGHDVLRHLARRFPRGTVLAAHPADLHRHVHEPDSLSASGASDGSSVAACPASTAASPSDPRAARRGNRGRR